MTGAADSHLSPWNICWPDNLIMASICIQIMFTPIDATFMECVGTDPPQVNPLTTCAGQTHGDGSASTYRVSAHTGLQSSSCPMMVGKEVILQ